MPVSLLTENACYACIAHIIWHNYIYFYNLENVFFKKYNFNKALM